VIEASKILNFCH
jgi:hypothetical protein